MNGLERHLQNKIEAEVGDLLAVTPALQIMVHHRGKKAAELRFGDNYKYFDLASLTKIIFTASVAMRLVDKKVLNVNAPVQVYWPKWRNKKAKVRDLLTHSAGLPWWIPAYRSLRGPLQPELRFQQLQKKLESVKLTRSKKSVYSDPDVWAVGILICELTGLSLEELWRKYCNQKYFGRMHFNPGNRPKHNRKLYAPTEKCRWRKKTLRGEVHDENAWALGGVAPHAGLFGRLEDVANWGMYLRRQVRAGGVAKTFTQRQLPASKGDFGYLFMKPSRPHSSAGTKFSKSSFGHTGFTGTSLWYDPVHDVQVVLLSNRVHPTRRNRRFVDLRPKIHDWIMEYLV